jgi:hypothetical protein
VIIDFYPPIRIGTRSARTGGLGGKNFKFQVLQAFFIRAICVIRELLLKSDAMADRMSILEKPDNLKSCRARRSLCEGWKLEIVYV